MVRTFIAVPAILLAVALAACGGDDDPSSPAGEWPTFFAMAELVESSDIVVVAQLGEEQTYTIEAPPATDGSRTSIVEIVRTYVVAESLKGDLLPGDLFNVFNTASVAVNYTGGRNPSESVYQVLNAEEDQDYLLFLNLVEVPQYYPEELGSFAWAAPGEPHTARVMDDGTLLWETTGRYDDAREQRDIPVGAQGAGPAFDLTIDVVAALAVSEASSPEASPSAAP